MGAKRCRKRREDDSEEQRKRSKRGEKRVEVKPRSGAGVKQMQESARRRAGVASEKKYSVSRCVSLRVNVAVRMERRNPRSVTVNAFATG